MVKQIQVFFLLFLCSLLAACASTHSETASTPTQVQDSGNNAFYESINQISLLIENNETDEARSLLTKLDNRARNANQHALLSYSYARLSLHEGDIEQANNLLNSTRNQQYLQQATDNTNVLSGLLNAQILEHKQLPLAAARQRIYIAPMLPQGDVYQDNHFAIWRLLNNANVNSLNLSNFNNELTLKQWLKLSQIAQHSQLPLAAQSRNIDQWLKSNPNHPAAQLMPPDVELILNAERSKPQKIAVILPLEGKFRSHGVAIRDGFMHAWFKAEQKTELAFYHFDESQGFTQAYQQAIADGAQMVIGPLFKEQVQELYRLGDMLPVPTIALNRIDDRSIPAPKNLYEFSLAIEDEVYSLITLAKRKQYQNALVIYQADSWSTRAAQAFIKQWQAESGNVLAAKNLSEARDKSAMVQDVLNINNSRQRSRELQQLTGLNFEFEPRRRQDIDTVVLITRPEAAASVRPLLSFHYASDIPVLATSSVYRGFPNTNFDSDLNGVYFTDAPLVISDRDQLTDNYRNSPLIRMHAMGMDAFLLSERINLMTLLNNSQLYGATGQLSVKGNHIERRTAYAQFQRGIARSLDLPAEATEEPHVETSNEPIDW